MRRTIAFATIETRCYQRVERENTWKQRDSKVLTNSSYYQRTKQWVLRTVRIVRELIPNTGTFIDSESPEYAAQDAIGRSGWE